MSRQNSFYVISDMDGVIFDTEQFFLDCLRPAAEAMGLKDIDTVAYDCIGLTVEETDRKLIEFYGPDVPLEEFRRKTSEIFDARYEAEGFTVKPGVRELFQYLRDQGIPVAVASSTRTDLVARELEDAGLKQYFDIIIGGNMAKRSKPAPDIFLKAAEELGARPEECFVIEDSFKGVRAAHAAGARTLMVPDLLEPDDEIRALAEAVFPSLIEVKDYLAAQL